MYARAANSHVLMRMLIVCTVTLLAATAIVFASNAPSAHAAGPYLNKSERAVMRAVNNQRARHGLSPLRHDRRLARAADHHSRDMIRANFFSHTSSNGTSMWRRVHRFRPSKRVGENLAYIHRSHRRRAARRIVKLWMRSSGHRAAILSRNFGRIGVARRIGRLRGMPVMVFTANFSSRR